MKKHLAALACATAFLSFPAFVQAAPASDPATVAATRQMLSAMKVRDLTMQSLRQAEQAMPQQMRAMVTQMIQGDATTTPAQKQQALDKFEKTLPRVSAAVHELLSDPKLVDQMVDEMVPLYADTYTVDEIRQLSAFYQSPLGQKMLANMPKLMAQSMEISNRVMMPRMQKLMTQIMSTVNGQ